jgi:hypothetical protein
MGSNMSEDRCPIHRVSLEIDALRGLVCPACDTELDQWGRDWPGRVWRVGRRVWRRLWPEALEALSTSHDPWSD